MSYFRAFIAIEPPTLLQDEIHKQTMRLRQTLGEELVNWVPTKNIHLTLKFLGDIPSTHLDFLKQSLTQIANSSQSFDLQVTGFGSFPNSKLPRILWVGLHTSAALKTLHQTVDEAMIKLGYKKDERAFSPHLTLGRVKQSITPNNIQKIRDTVQTFQLGKIDTARVHSVHLFKSELNPEGSIYTKLFSTNFKQ